MKKSPQKKTKSMVSVPASGIDITTSNIPATIKRYAIPISNHPNDINPSNMSLTPATRPNKRNSIGAEPSVSGSGTSDDEDVDGGKNDDDDKKNKRRKQIAAASRASRARRKRELEDLREENKRLREERSQFLSKIGDLQMKVEGLRERGSTDMRIENELLRAQLEEHKRFVNCFKRLCDGAPTSLNAKHMIYKQGSDAAQAQVLSLISQSQADDWQEALIPDNFNIPLQNFCMFYKFKTEIGDQVDTELSISSNSSITSGESGSSMNESKSRRRLHVRVDALFPSTDASNVADFFWNTLTMTDYQNRIYGVKGVEFTQLSDDMPDKDTKMVYYREKHHLPKKDVDWVLICNQKRRDLAKSTLTPPNKKGTKPQLGRAGTIVTAMCTTQHSATPIFDNADRITSLFVQGCVSWNVGSDCRACIVLSFPDDFKIKAIEGFSDIIDENGIISKKFVHLLENINQVIKERSAEAVSAAPLMTV